MIARDDVLARIEAFNRAKGGGVLAEYRQGGFTLWLEATGAPTARRKPTGRDHRMDIHYWSHKGTWSDYGPLGGTVLPLDDPLAFIADEPLFWTLTKKNPPQASRPGMPFWAKSRSGFMPGSCMPR